MRYLDEEEIKQHVKLYPVLEMGQGTVFMVLDDNIGERITFYIDLFNSELKKQHIELCQLIKTENLSLGIPNNWGFAVYQDNFGLCLEIHNNKNEIIKYNCYNEQMVEYFTDFFD
jgi:hypothetical protein